jgi:hypothetical protein
MIFMQNMLCRSQLENQTALLSDDFTTLVDVAITPFEKNSPKGKPRG